MMSESQPTILNYCVDCGAPLYEIDGKRVWRPEYCPYSGGSHRVETEIRIPEMEDVVDRINYFQTVISESDNPIQRIARKVIHG